MSVAVRLEGIGKSFVTSAGEVDIIGQVDLGVEEGEFVAIVGASGCGKSTLLRMVAGLEPITRGIVRVGTVPVTGPGADRAMVFQDYSLYPWLTVRENVLFATCLVSHRGQDPSRRRARFEALMALMGLANHAHKRPGQLSGGLQQRVAIARALMARPRVLLMDEPFGALDAQTREVMHDVLLHLHASEAMTVLFVTHDVEEALYLSRRVVVLAPHPGRVDSVYESPLPDSGARHVDMKLDVSFTVTKGTILQRIRETAGITFSRQALAAAWDQDPICPTRPPH
jgi:NitT/TauT family transport system ATP-binding protein